MFRIPKYFIFLFVGLSILTAYGIHRFQSTPGRQLASMGDGKNHLDSLEEGAQEILSFSKSTDSSCYCLRDNSARSLEVMPEEREACASERLYLDSWIESRPVLYRESRLRTSSEFPKECLIYSMKKWRGDGGSTSARFANHCAQGDSDDLPNAPKPCVSKNYVNVAYNYFSDVTDCFGVSQRRWIPKFYYENGFHTNARSFNGTLGLGNLSKPMIAEANRFFLLYQSQISELNKPSCERLRSAIERLKPIQELQQNRCARFEALQDPLLSLFYATITELQNRNLILEMMKKPFGHRGSVLERMEKLGLARGSYDDEKLVDILSMLGSQAGPESAVILLSNYLEDFPRLTRRQLKTSDLSVSGSSDKVRSFFEYIRENQVSGDSHYLQSISEKARDLNQHFKEGACVPESFLSL